MWIGTFHGLCNRMLRAHYRDANLPQLFQIMDTQDQLALIKRLYKRARHRRRALPAAAAAAVHLRREGGGPAPQPGRGGRRLRAPPGRALRAVRGDVPARGRRRFRGAAAAQLRAARPATRAARALPAPLLAHAGRRVPGHQRAAVQVAAAARGRAHGGVRGRRRRPVDLRVPRRERRQHAALRARFRRDRRCRCGSSSSSRTTARTATSSPPPTR